MPRRRGHHGAGAAADRSVDGDTQEDQARPPADARRQVATGPAPAAAPAALPVAAPAAAAKAATAAAAPANEAGAAAPGGAARAASSDSESDNSEVGFRKKKKAPRAKVPQDPTSREETRIQSVLASHKNFLEGSSGEKCINGLAAVLGAHAPPPQLIALLAGRGRPADVAAFKTISKMVVIPLPEDVDHSCDDFFKAVGHAVMSTKVSSLYSSSIVMNMRTALRARATKQVHGMQVRKRLQPSKIAIHKTVLEQLEAAISARSLTVPVAPLPPPDESGGVLVSNILLLLHLGTWQGLVLFINLVLEEAALPAPRLTGALGKDDYGVVALEGGHNSITAYLFAKAGLGKLKSDVYKPPQSCISELNAHHTYTVGAEVSMIAYFLREACQIAMPKDGSIKLVRHSALDSADTVHAIQAKNLNAAVFKAITDLEKHKAGDDHDAPRMRIFAPASSDLGFAVAGATTALTIKSSFDNTRADSPLFPFSASAQSMYDFIEVMVVQRRNLEKIPAWAPPAVPAADSKSKRSAGQKRSRKPVEEVGVEEEY